MLATWGSTIIGKLLSSFFGSLFKSIGDYFAKKRSEENLKQLGAERATRQGLEEAGKVKEAMSKETNRERSKTEVKDRLKKGTF